MKIQFKKWVNFALSMFNKYDKKNNVDMVNLNSTIKLPPKSKLTEQELESYKAYKSEYSSVVKEPHILNSKDLESTELQGSLNLYINLLLDLFDENTELRNTTNKTKLLKMNLYLAEIAKLETESLLRLKALKEVFRKSLNLFSRNKATIANEITILENDYLIFKSQKEHATNEIKNYILLSTLETKEDDHIDQRLEELTILAYRVSKDDAENIVNSDISKEIKIAFLEKLLEIYVYKNKDKIKDINAQLDRLGEFEVAEGNRANLLKDIMKIEQLYKVYYYFGKNLVSDEELYKLYQLKLYLLSYDMFSNWHDEIKNCRGIESKFYQKILSDILQNIITGTNPYMESQFGEDMNLAIKFIERECKNSEDKFNFEDLLKDRNKTIFLLQCEKEFGLREYFKKILVSQEFQYVFNNPLRVEYAIPLASEFEIKYAPFMEHHHRPSLKGSEDFELYYIYDFIKKNTPASSKYTLPEGIIEIKGHIWGNMLSYFKQSIQNKTEIFFPKSLRIFDCNILADMKDPIHLLYLNDGLQEVGMDNNSSNGPIVHTLSIPNSLKYISKKFIDFSQVKTLIFRDCELYACKHALTDNIAKILNYCFKENDAWNSYLAGNGCNYEDIFSLDEIYFTNDDFEYPIKISKLDIIKILTICRSEIFDCSHYGNEFRYIANHIMTVTLAKKYSLRKQKRLLKLFIKKSE